MTELSDRLPQPYKGFHYRKSDGAFIINAEEIDKAIEVMKADNLKSLELNPNFFNATDLSFLSKFDFIDEISILINGIKDITPVNSLKNLKKISIEHRYKGEIDYTSFPLLEHSFMVWGPGSETIFECGNLNNLTIYNFPKFELLQFGGLANLYSLKLVNGRMVSLLGIEALQDLEVFELYYCSDLENLRGVELLQNLHRFVIENCKKIKSLEIIADVSSLKYLNFSNMGDIPTIEYLYTLVNLEEVVFTEKVKIIDGNLNVLAYLKDKAKLKRAVFINRKTYTHTREQLGYVRPPEVAAILRASKTK